MNLHAPGVSAVSDAELRTFTGDVASTSALTYGRGGVSSVLLRIGRLAG